MVRRSAVSVFALVAAFVLGMMLSNRPATVSAQAAAGRGKCVGVAAHATVIYRAFEDGTVESLSFADGAPDSPWHKVGK